MKHKIKFHITSVERAINKYNSPMIVSPLNNGIKMLVDELAINDSQEIENLSGIAFFEGIGKNKVVHVIGLVLKDRLFEIKRKSYAV